MAQVTLKRKKRWYLITFSEKSAWALWVPSTNRWKACHWDISAVSLMLYSWILNACEMVPMSCGRESANEHCEEVQFSCSLWKEAKTIESSLWFFLKKRRRCSLDRGKFLDSSHMDWERSSPRSRIIVFVQNGTPLAGATARTPPPNTL